ncbi:hypothetical protein [Winogradskyella marincola]|uniref:Uncharacterized protein n=1 Tax=Winogradskyella marincola TaxID=3037795 RepID=A0ABT6G5L5_9FLAO|nr:hypothetical protein [Winogradskyella sp. YYF002]MDG4717335.1 hypothetical protein [Winogradskyella sp. YYF002]
MDIEYLPNKGFILNSVKIEWNSERNSVREKIGKKYKEDDRTIDVAQFFDGDESMNIHQKRDIYENLNSKNDMIFLNYNKDNKLTELEVHSGFSILIDNIRLDFGNEISDFIKQFEKNGIEYSETEKGNYLLPKLKITIADSESIGGDGTGLSYFYAASDISHLTE